MPADRPNVLCIVTDQQRADHLGFMGNPVIQTPNLDRLAASGVHFTRAYVNNPLCMPSRATMFTGLTTRGHRVRTNGIPLDPSFPTLPGILAEHGYRTHSVGKIHLHNMGIPKGADASALDPADWPEAAAMWTSGQRREMPLPYYGLQTVCLADGHGQGVFGHYLDWLKREHPDMAPLLRKPSGHVPACSAEGCSRYALPKDLHHSTFVADRTIEFLKGEGRDRPFFLWCSFPDPHHPYTPPAPFDTMYDPADVVAPVRRDGELDDLAPFVRQIYESRLPLSGRFAPTRMSDECIRTILAYTYGMVSLIDKGVGRILDALDGLGLAANTIVVYFTDHGGMMGDHFLLNKGPFHFEGLLRSPLVWRWPGKLPAGRRVDSLASFLDLAPTILDLLGIAVPEGMAPDPPEAPEMPPPWPGVSLGPVLRGQTHKVNESVIVENDEDYLGLRLRTLITDEHKLTVYPGQPYGELFDLKSDPNELHNLWGDAASRTLKTELTAELLEKLILTDAALPRRLSHA